MPRDFKNQNSFSLLEGGEKWGKHFSQKSACILSLICIRLWGLPPCSDVDNSVVKKYRFRFLLCSWLVVSCNSASSEDTVMLHRKLALSCFTYVGWDEASCVTQFSEGIGGQWFANQTVMEICTASRDCRRQKLERDRVLCLLLTFCFEILSQASGAKTGRRLQFGKLSAGSPDICHVGCRLGRMYRG